MKLRTFVTQLQIKWDSIFEKEKEKYLALCQLDFCNDLMLREKVGNILHKFLITYENR